MGRLKGVLIEVPEPEPEPEPEPSMYEQLCSALPDDVHPLELLKPDDTTLLHCSFCEEQALHRLVSVHRRKVRGRNEPTQAFYLSCVSCLKEKRVLV